MAKTYDYQCYMLAAHFLSDHSEINTEAARITLAREIQMCVEDEITFMRLMIRKPTDAQAESLTKRSV
jgi:hypothetical protein